ncbi:MAG: HAD-IA family hydrolase [Desulfobacterales bacterium]|nr:HAD-IA family hydrolase [Desulfobacterales bacterium]
MSVIRAIVFDLDGTLIDSVRDLAASVNHTLGRLGLAGRSEEEVGTMIGDGARKLLTRALGPGREKLLDQALSLFLDHYGRHCTEHTVLLDGAIPMLEELGRTRKLGVLTNKPHHLSEQILTSLRVRCFFSEVIGGDSLGVKKPDPAGLLHLAAIWSLTPAEILMVGDHATDIATGHAAGSPVVFLEGSIGESRGLTPERTIRSLVELPALAAELQSRPT